MPFINTAHKNTIDSLVEGLKEKLNNPYYLFNDKKATIVDYYNINIEKTTLDEATKISEGRLSENMKYNLIKDAYLFGIDRIEVNLDFGDSGLEANEISGDAIVLPNTWEPHSGDFFRINYLKDSPVFKVISVTSDTLESGANFWKLSYELEYVGKNDTLDSRVIQEYKMIVNNIGTQYNTIIRSNDYDLIEEVEIASATLKKYFKNLFFDNKVQTFVYIIDEDYRIYDPYMIEFLIRNSILSNNEDYTHIAHETVLHQTFGIDYDRTIFRAIELKDFRKFDTVTLQTAAIEVQDTNSLLTTRSYPYYQINFSALKNIYNGVISIMSPELIDHHTNKTFWDDGDPDEILNILLRYFRSEKIDTKYIKMLEDLSYFPSKDLFYRIPIFIYILESYAKMLLLTSQ